MKNLVGVSLLVGGLALGMAMGTNSNRNIDNRIAVDTCIVIERTDSGCLLADTKDDTWYYEYDSEKLELNELVTMVIDNKGTSDLNDDEILRVVRHQSDNFHK